MQTAVGGAASLQLQDPVKGWEVGQQVVLTTTIWKDEQVGYGGGARGLWWGRRLACRGGSFTSQRGCPWLLPGLCRPGPSRPPTSPLLPSPRRRRVQENQNEVVTVGGVSPDGRTLYLAAPLQYQHYG